MKFYTLFFCSLVGFAPLSYGWWGYTLDCTEKKGKKDSWDEAKNSTCVNDEDQFEDNPNWRRAFVKKIALMILMIRSTKPIQKEKQSVLKVLKLSTRITISTML